MKRLLALLLAFASVVCVGTFTVNATETPESGALVLQDLDYSETINRVNLMDAGFTMSSTAIYAHHLDENSIPRNDSGFQFYYISLSKYSGSFEQFEDRPIDGWFLEYLDCTLANLRNNGGGCMIRATYGLDGQQNCEPTDFELLLEHVKQLSEVISRYPDVVSTIECGMIGAFGEMWGGLYSRSVYKAQVLDTWLKNTPDSVTVNVRTANEYFFYVNESELYKEKYKNQTVNGIKYPEEIKGNAYWQYYFEDTDFARIGIYDDAMLQDGNHGGTFPWSEVGSDHYRSGFFTFLHNQGSRASYGGEFSGAAGIYRWKLINWMPLRAIPELYRGHLSYYHGGNNAYKHTGKFYGEYTDSHYGDEGTLTHRIETLENNVALYGSGMTQSVVSDRDDCKVRYPDNTYSAVMTYDEAQALADEYNAEHQGGGATVHTRIYLTTGGWSSANVSDELLDAIAEMNDVTADLTDYLGTTVAKYFEDHVGYRLVLRESQISGVAYTGGGLRIKGKIDNTGFANITREKRCELLLVGEDNTYVIPTDIDVRDWKSAQRTAYDTTVTLPPYMVTGEYKVFMRISDVDPDGRTVEENAIPFANPGEYTYTTPGSTYNVGTETFASCFNDEVDGNYIGSFTVEERWDANPYKDVSISNWYYKAVKYMTEEGLMNGVTANSFGPEQAVTRGMLVTILYRLEGSPEVEATGAFTDVESDKWYYNAVEWAKQNEIVNGMTATTFAPEANITREQIATIMYRYASFKGYDTSVRAGEMMWNFIDMSKISNYAFDAMDYAVGTGLINGKGMMQLCPKDNAKRNEIATILMRFIEGNK